MSKKKSQPSEYDLGRLQDLWEENRYASAAALHAFARRESIDVSLADVRQFLQRVSTTANREVFHIPKQEGRAFARSPFEEVKVDLMDRQARPAPDGSKYVLVAQDAFTRQVFSENLPDKNASTAARAFDRVLDRMPQKPETVLTDLGTEFKGPFEDSLERRGIVHKDKAPDDYGAFASIDRTIRTLKKQVALRGQDGVPWHTAITQAVRDYNKTPHAATGTAPGKVLSSPEAQFHISKTMSENWLHNQDLQKRRIAKIESKGGFREQLPRPGPRGWREDSERYGPARELLDADRDTRYGFGYVHDSDGNAVLIKRALASSSFN